MMTDQTSSSQERRDGAPVGAAEYSREGGVPEGVGKAYASGIEGGIGRAAEGTAYKLEARGAE